MFNLSECITEAEFAKEIRVNIVAMLFSLLRQIANTLRQVIPYPISVTVAFKLIMLIFYITNCDNWEPHVPIPGGQELKVIYIHAYEYINM